MIEITDLTKRFGKFVAVNQVSLSFKAGNSVALIGPNGCGKTTLIKSILGMVIPNTGTITVLNENIINGYLYRASIGYMPQIGKYPENMEVGKLLNTIQELRNTKAVDMDLYHAYKLKTWEHKRLATLSGGTKQKVSAILAFMFNAPILILDEPTAGLDPIAAEILKEKIIAEKQNNKLVLITSHILSELDSITNQIVFMQDGEVLFNKDRNQLLTDTGAANLSGAIIHTLKEAYHV